MPSPRSAKNWMNSVDVQAEHLRPDDDAEQQLDHDRRHQQAARAEQRRERAADRGGDDDREERVGLDVDRRQDHERESLGRPRRRITPIA